MGLGKRRERKMTDRERQRLADEALGRAREKYPNFDAFRPTMAAIALADDVDFSRPIVDVYAELYFRATMGDGRWVYRREKCWQPN